VGHLTSDGAASQVTDVEGPTVLGRLSTMKLPVSGAVVEFYSGTHSEVSRHDLVLSFAAIDAQLLYAAPSHLICAISGEGLYQTGRAFS
jgi:hypothetical protein